MIIATVITPGTHLCISYQKLKSISDYSILWIYNSNCTIYDIGLNTSLSFNFEK